jgi:hypothetical protein
MIFGYSANSKNLGTKGLLVAMGVVAIPLSFQMHGGGSAAPVPQKAPMPSADPRVAKLQHFFHKLDCPVAGLAQDFVRVADENDLDWRLLPSIAVVESGGGKAYRHNNIFGWDQGNQAFPSIRSGLELVGSKLGKSPLYRERDSFGKLRIYNENQDYAHSVLKLMNRISSYN